MSREMVCEHGKAKLGKSNGGLSRQDNDIAKWLFGGKCRVYDKHRHAKVECSPTGWEESV